MIQTTENIIVCQKWPWKFLLFEYIHIDCHCCYKLEVAYAVAASAAIAAAVDAVRCYIYSSIHLYFL